ncbi:MAG: purine-nucleoside phosphorylase [Chloroflexi bacterium]|nr:purine-nucleoside phosphorylase [Chloroflexota bacterium]
MSPVVLRGEPEDYAALVLLPGDPQRARAIAERFDGGLDGARQVSAHRGLLGWTGTFRNVPVSVQTTGMGSPAMAIIAEELIRLGARRLVRVGTCGGIGIGIRTGDIVVATAAAPVDGATRTHLGGEPYAPVPDFDLTRALVDAARASGLPTHVGPVATVDLLYNPDPDYVPRWRNRGILAFEMEAAALFYLASRASAEGRDARAACILTVSDVLSETLTTEETYLPLDELERATDRMIVSALDGSLAFDAT